MTSRNNEKPGIYGFVPAMAAPEWAWFWDSVVLAVPMWEGAGDQNNAVIREYAFQQPGTVSDLYGQLYWQQGEDGSMELHWDEISSNASGVHYGDHPSKYAINETGQVSIVAGVFPDDVPDSGGGGRIVSHGFSSSGDNWSLMFSGNNGARTILLRINNNDLITDNGGIVPAGQYSQIAGTYRPGSPKIWANGVEITQTSQVIRYDSFTAPPAAGTHPVIVGRNAATDSSRQYRGSMQYVYVFKVELTQAQLLQIRDDPFGMFRQHIRYIPQDSGPTTITGSGALAAATATMDGSGNATGLVTGSGALSAQQATTSGSGTVTRVASGTLAAQTADLSGTAVRTATGTGALAAQQATLSGSAVPTTTGSGALVGQQATLSGTATRTVTGTGALAAGAADVSASVVLGRNATGALAAQQATLSGSGQLGAIETATGALAAQQATLSGTATRTVTGTGALAAQQATLAASGSVTSTFTGTGALAATQASVTATALIGWNASGALAAQQATLDGSGTAASTLTGSGALQAANATLEATGTAYTAASGALVAGLATMTGAGSVALAPRTAEGELQAQAAEITAQILRTVKGSGTMTANAAGTDVYMWVELHTQDNEWVEQKVDWGRDL